MDSETESWVPPWFVWLSRKCHGSLQAEMVVQLQVPGSQLKITETDLAADITKRRFNVRILTDAETGRGPEKRKSIPRTGPRFPLAHLQSHPTVLYVEGISS